METSLKRAATISKVRELQLPWTEEIENEYDILREIGSGDYGKVSLAKHKSTGTEVALKAIPKATTPLRDFLMEFHYSYFLSPHPCILDTYDVSFETPQYYYFAQEVAPLGDLWQVIEQEGGIEEAELKIVLQQVVPALEFMHSKGLVHRDVRAENILLFSRDLRKVKLTDFGLTRRAGTLVKKRSRSLPTCPPEIWEMVNLEGYHVELGSDVWQIAMLIFIALTAHFPWDKADITDLRFNEFIEWQKRKTTRTPREFKRFTPRLLRMLRRLMEQKPSKRYEITEVNKYYADRWVLIRQGSRFDLTVDDSPGQSSANPNLLSPTYQAEFLAEQRKNSFKGGTLPRLRETTPSAR
ncbi:serine/threonine-protein kinase SBK1-like [Varroa jacobsoni]|uniref:Protein kinase domain-containing protein n=1 Tax=Varroa destructor TaxID=109461 RepID=A0A7M7MIY2_VARDE|nr:serine/threonine-protein kinase SBK1-like isoform X1 [Varroa destructor]XP_022694334.1 serine/threonine-protein kinase SBK1-like [Varroa jacobsoni]